MLRLYLSWSFQFHSDMRPGHTVATVGNVAAAATVSVVADDSLSFLLLDSTSAGLLCFSSIKATQKIPLQLCTGTTALLPLSLLLWLLHWRSLLCFGLAPTFDTLGPWYFWSRRTQLGQLVPKFVLLSRCGFEYFFQFFDIWWSTLDITDDSNL